MSKLTKADRNSLLNVLRLIDGAHTYIQSDKIAVCMVRDRATNALDYVRSKPFNEHIDRQPSDALPIARIAKDIGSPLAYLPTAIRQLKILLGDTVE